MFVLDCGCDLQPGKPIQLADLKAHWRHTFNTMVIWDLMMDQNGQRSTVDLMQARLKYFEELEKTFPEAV